MNSEPSPPSAPSSLVQEITELLAKITPGEWVIRPFEASYVDRTSLVLVKPVRAVAVAEGDGHRWITTACELNAEAIAAMPRLLRQAAAEIEGLRREIQKVADDLTAENEDAHERLNAAEARAEAAEALNRELQEALKEADADGIHHRHCRTCWEKGCPSCRGTIPHAHDCRYERDAVAENASLRARIQTLEQRLREVVDSPGCSDGDCCPAALKQTAAIENAKAALAASRGREPEET